MNPAEEEEKNAKRVKKVNPSSPTPSTSSGVSSASSIFAENSAQERERIPDEPQGGEIQLQILDDSDAVEAARILCSFSSAI